MRVNEYGKKDDKKTYIASVKMSPTMLATMSATILGSEKEISDKIFEDTKKSEGTRHKNGFW